MDLGIVYTVPQGHIALKERFGRLIDIQEPGPHYLIPILESVHYVQWGDVANKEGWKIETTEQHTSTPTMTIQTKDDQVKGKLSIAWKIIKPDLAVSKVDRLPESITAVACNALRSKVARYPLDQAVTLREQLNQDISSELEKVVSEWGVKVLRVEIQELSYSDATAQARMREMVAEKNARATITEAQGAAEACLKKAEAEAQALMVEMKSRAEALKLLAEADRQYLAALKQEVPVERAVEILKAQKQGRSMEVISQNPANKVFIPHGTSAPIVTTQG